MFFSRETSTFPKKMISRQFPIEVSLSYRLIDDQLSQNWRSKEGQN